MSAPPPSSFTQRRFIRSKPSKLAKSKSPQQFPQHQIEMLHVVNTFSSDTTSPCIMLYTHNHTYVFNCGEGTQRISQNNGRTPKHSDLFLTRLSWDVMGGLPGTYRIRAWLISRLSFNGIRPTGFKGESPWPKELDSFPCKLSKLYFQVAGLLSTKLTSGHRLISV
jgi:hypothetical protein